MISDDLLMGKKKGKVLALELVGDLFDKNKDKNSKKNKEPGTEVLTTPTEMPQLDEVATEKISKTQLHTLESEVSPEQQSTLAASRVSLDNSLERTLSQTNNLKKAQNKILKLESVIDELRQENEQLIAATESFKKNDEELSVKLKDLKIQLVEAKEQFDEEKSIIVESKNSLEKQLREAKSEIEQLKSRLNSNLKKIRVRERELENRLEIIKMDNVSLQRSKDERLLNLKRQIDDIHMELDGYKQKEKVLDLELEKNKNMLRKTVKALRLALTMLEMDEESFKNISGGES